MRTVEHMDFSKPDEVRPFGHGRAEILNTSEGAIGRLVLEPGWRWSQDVKPVAGTEWCEAPHFQYHASGTLHVRMADGSESSTWAEVGSRPASRPRRMGRRRRAGRRGRLLRRDELRQVVTRG